jgi:hypothetical protein
MEEPSELDIAAPQKATGLIVAINRIVNIERICDFQL